MAQIVATVAALAIVVQCLCSMNQMSRETDHRIRMAFLALVVSAASVVLAPLYGYPAPQWPDAFVLTAFSTYLFANQRRSFFSLP